MATLTTTSGGTITSFANTQVAKDDSAFLAEVLTRV